MKKDRSETHVKIRYNVFERNKFLSPMHEKRIESQTSLSYCNLAQL